MRKAREVWRAFLTPVWQFRINLALTLVWLALFLPGLISWSQSVPFLVICSIYANVAGHLAGMAAAAGARYADPGDDLC